MPLRALALVYFARINFCPFSIPLGARDWLRFVIVALHSLDFSNNLFALLYHFRLDKNRGFAAAAV